MKYQRITDPNKLCCEYRYHERFYYALQVLENEIQNNTIQYRQAAIKPIVGKHTGKVICRECKKALPKAYPRFCGNCGTRLRPEVASMDMIFYETSSFSETVNKHQMELLRGTNYGKDKIDLWPSK